MKTIKSIKHLLKISVIPLIALLMGIAPAAHADPILKVAFGGNATTFAGGGAAWSLPAGWNAANLGNIWLGPYHTAELACGCDSTGQGGVVNRPSYRVPVGWTFGPYTVTLWDINEQPEYGSSMLVMGS